MQNTRAVTREIRRSRIHKENNPKNKQTKKQINRTQNTKIVTGEHSYDSSQTEIVKSEYSGRKNV